VRTKKELLPGEWAVLALLCERPAHGYAIAALMAPEGDVGEIWSLSEQLTYKTLRTLQTLGYVEVSAVKSGNGAPRRTELTATPEGKRLVTRWLRTPERHIRDLRPNLLLKLHLLQRRGRSPLPLLEAQRDLLSRTIAAFDADDTTREPTLLLKRWRRTMAAAAQVFVEEMLSRDEAASPRQRPRGR
jgi:DNA-binding PadR family transcriptional regulator